MNVLEGIKIIDFSRLVPGPLATRQLMQMGAEVLKVEHPDKPELIRQIPPFEEGTSVAYLMMNRGKDIRQIAYDQPEGKQLIYDWILTADVIVESFRPGIMAKLGFSYADFKRINPNIIYVSATAYGQSGPYAALAGHDLNFMAISGLLSLNGKKDAVTIPSFQMADIYGGTEKIVQAVLAGIIRRQKDQGGGWYDISITESTLPMAALVAVSAWHKTNKTIDLLSGDLPNYTIYKCQDGKQLVFAGLEMKFWKTFCNLMDKPQWRDIPFDQLIHQPEIKSELQQTFLTKTREEWLMFFHGYDLCISPVLHLEETLSDPHLKEKQIFQFKEDSNIPVGWNLGIRKIG